MKCRPAASELLANASFVCRICFIFHMLPSMAYDCENSHIEIDILTDVLPYQFEPQALPMPARLSNSSINSRSCTESNVDETDGSTTDVDIW